MAKIELKSEEAIVFIDFLLRFRDSERLSIAHPAEARADGLYQSPTFASVPGKHNNAFAGLSFAYVEQGMITDCGMSL